MEDVVAIPAGALPPGDPDYVARMIARVDGPVVVETPVVTTPAPLLAGKYKTLADLEKGYLELQKVKSGPAVAKPVVAPVAKPVVVAPAAAVPPALNADGTPVVPVVAAPAVDPALAAAEAAVANAGLDFAALSTEFSTSGALAEESYTALEASGIPRNMVDQFLEGQQAIQERSRNEVFEITKGKDGYISLVTWASTNLDADEIAAYDAAVNGSDMNATKLAVSGLAARMAAAEGTEPVLVGGEASSTAGYSSTAELKAAIKDPRYATDAAYRKSVEDKLAVSNY